MKTKRSKKFYALTEKQKRRDRSRKTPTCMFHMCDADFRRTYNRLRRARAKEAMKLILLGRDVEFPKLRKDVLWDYW